MGKGNGSALWATGAWEQVLIQLINGQLVLNFILFLSFAVFKSLKLEVMDSQPTEKSNRIAEDGSWEYTEVTGKHLTLISVILMSFLPSTLHIAS